MQKDLSRQESLPERSCSSLHISYTLYVEHRKVVKYLKTGLMKLTWIF